MFDGVPVWGTGACPKEDLPEARNVKAGTQTNGPSFDARVDAVPVTGVGAHGQGPGGQDPVGVVAQQVVLRRVQLGCLDQGYRVVAGSQLPNFELPKPFTKKAREKNDNYTYDGVP